MITFANPNFRSKSRLRDPSPIRDHRDRSANSQIRKVFVSPKKVMPSILNGEPNLSESFSLMPKAINAMGPPSQIPIPSRHQRNSS